MKILKIGGSLIAPKSSDKPLFQKDVMDEIAAALSSYVAKNKQLVIVHGAGSFGHLLVKKAGFSGIKTKEDEKNAAEIHASCRQLSKNVINSLAEKGIQVTYIDPSKVIVQRGGRITRFDTSEIESQLAKRIIPVLHGDIVPDEIFGASVCSGDQIVAWLAKKADAVVFATDVDGVLDKNGNIIKMINKKNVRVALKHISGARNDVTGGMRGKVLEILKSNVPTWIVNGRHPERIVEALSGKQTVGTLIAPDK
ncbi:MAG: isopentenyl phosphate kinase [Candidatus Bilamarchaeaceae archaeon]